MQKPLAAKRKDGSADPPIITPSADEMSSWRTRSTQVVEVGVIRGDVGRTGGAGGQLDIWLSNRRFNPRPVLTDPPKAVDKDHSRAGSAKRSACAVELFDRISSLVG